MDKKHNIATRKVTDVPADPSKELGLRMKDLRLSRGMTLAQLGKLTGLSVSSLSQVERGLVSPTIRTVYSVATALDVPPAWIIDPASAGNWTSGEEYVVRAARRTEVLNSNGVIKHLATPDSEQRYKAFVVTVRPGGSSGDEQYTHSGEEIGFVISGTITIEVESRSFRLNKGDSFAFSSSLGHRFSNDSASDAVIFWVNSIE